MSKTYTNSLIESPVSLKKTSVVLPESWYAAAGMMAHKKEALVKHGKQIRKEWDSSR